MNKILLNNRSKQTIIMSLAFFLIFFGYLNYSHTVSSEDDNKLSARDNEKTFGDVELVNANVESNDYLSGIVSNDDLYEENREIEESKVDYFRETKLERDRIYSEMIETYQELISNDKTPEDQKTIAVQEINNITRIKNEIMISENLILNKGFSNVVILANNGNINVVVEASNLLQEDIAKIQNIIEREFQVEIKNINISNR